MAIAFDAVSLPTLGSTWTHTCTGADRILFVVTRDAVTAVTYAGVSLSLVQSLALGGSIASLTPLQLWWLMGPASGAHTVALTGGTGVDGLAASYTGAQQAGSIDAVTTHVSSAGATTLTTTLTTVADNCWLVCAEAAYIFGGNPTNGTLTLRGNIGAYGLPAIFDSDGARSPAGSQSGSTTLPFGNEPIYHILASFAPAPPALTGDGDVTVGPPALAGTGTYTPADVSGTGDVTLGPPALAGTGGVINPVTGTGGVTFGKPALAGTGTVATVSSTSLVTQTSVETFGLELEPEAHTTQTSLEVFGRFPVAAQVTTIGIEVFGLPDPPGHEPDPDGGVPQPDDPTDGDTMCGARVPLFYVEIQAADGLHSYSWTDTPIADAFVSRTGKIVNVDGLQWALSDVTGRGVINSGSVALVDYDGALRALIAAGTYKRTQIDFFLIDDDGRHLGDAPFHCGQSLIYDYTSEDYIVTLLFEDRLGSQSMKALYAKPVPFRRFTAAFNPTLPVALLGKAQPIPYGILSDTDTASTPGAPSALSLISRFALVYGSLADVPAPNWNALRPSSVTPWAGGLTSGGVTMAPNEALLREMDAAYPGGDDPTTGANWNALRPAHAPAVTDVPTPLGVGFPSVQVIYTGTRTFGAVPAGDSPVLDLISRFALVYGSLANTPAPNWNALRPSSVHPWAGGVTSGGVTMAPNAALLMEMDAAYPGGDDPTTGANWNALRPLHTPESPTTGGETWYEGYIAGCATWGPYAVWGADGTLDDKGNLLQVRLPAVWFEDHIGCPNVGGAWAAYFGARKYVVLDGMRHTVIYIRQGSSVGEAFKAFADGLSAGPPPSASNPHWGAVPVHVSLGGIEEKGDGTQRVITDLARQLQHLLTNFVDQNHTTDTDWYDPPLVATSAGSFTPYGNINHASIEAVRAQIALRLGGGYVGATVLGFDLAQATLGDVLQRFAVAGDFDFFIDRHGRFSLAIETPGQAVVTAFTIRQILQGTYKNWLDGGTLANAITIKFWKNFCQTNASCTLRPTAPLPPGEWLSAPTTVTDDASITDHGGDPVGRVEYAYEDHHTRDWTYLTPANVRAHVLARRKNGLERHSFETDLCGLDVQPGDVFTVQHDAGLHGDSVRRVRCTSVALHPPNPFAKSWSVTLTGYDVTDLADEPPLGGIL